MNEQKKINPNRQEKLEKRMKALEDYTERVEFMVDKHNNEARSAHIQFKRDIESMVKNHSEMVSTIMAAHFGLAILFCINLVLTVWLMWQ